ncbi:MAG: hypothetical protein NVSMB62_26840 [Acidobacteriaceae bacterium]
MSVFQQFALGLYRHGLKLYPRAFRVRYELEMLDAAAATLAEGAGSPLRTAAGLAVDLCISLVSEHRRAASVANPVFAMVFAMLVSGVLLGLAVQNQRVLRRGADLQPERIVSQMQARTANATSSGALVDGPSREIATADWLNGTDVFSAVCDESGAVIAASATLRGRLPQPPRGIFQFVRRYGQHRVTWQPASGIRLALTVERMPNGGFVLAGQSLAPSETRERRFRTLLLWIWAGTLATIAGGAVVRSRGHSARTI